MSKEKKNISNDGCVLTHLFDYELNQCSPVADDYVRKVNYDEDGNEFITYEKVDYAKIQSSNGLVGSWTLDALLKAGIDPAFPIHTSNPTRLDGIDVVTRAEEVADFLLSDIEGSKNEENK